MIERERRQREKIRVRERLEMALIEKEESARESQDVKAGFYPMGSDGYQLVSVQASMCEWRVTFH